MTDNSALSHGIAAQGSAAQESAAQGAAAGQAGAAAQGAAAGQAGAAGRAGAGHGGRDVLVHRALLYESRREYMQTSVSYLRAGRRAGDAVVVITPPPVAAVLREQLGPETAAAIEFIDAAEWFRGPMHALASCHDRARGDWWPRGRLRLLAEPVWDGRTPLETREWKRHDALLNVVFAGTPTMIMCAYDAAALPGNVLDDAARTHPELARPDGTAPAERFTDPAAFCAECDAGPLPPPPATAARRSFATGGLPGLLSFLSAEAARCGLPAERTLPFVLAVNEVATGIVRDGGGHGSLWMWAEGGELVCDVTDPARVLIDPFPGYEPPGVPGHDAAMWAVRRLCHLVEIRSGPHGTQIRLRVKLG